MRSSTWLLVHEGQALHFLKCSPSFVGLAFEGNDIVFRFIIECSSLRDFGPLSNNNNNRSIFI
jgi:hypothetical protein